MLLAKPTSSRSVAQPGSALIWGVRGRRFESCRSDQFLKPYFKSPKIDGSMPRYFLVALTASIDVNNMPSVAGTAAPMSP